LGPAKLRFAVQETTFPSTPKINACKIFNFAARKIVDFSTAYEKQSIRKSQIFDVCETKFHNSKNLWFLHASKS
jgi:hypothetical protein